MELPEILNKVEVDYIDARPDGEYSLRILKHYRKKCDERWQVSGLSKEQRLIYDLMNEHQKQRAAELDTAISLLNVFRTKETKH